MSVIKQIKEHQDMQLSEVMPTGHDRTIIEHGYKKYQLQKSYKRTFPDGTVIRSMRWETVTEVQS